MTVEVVYGRPDEDDEIVQPGYITLTAEAPAPPVPRVRRARVRRTRFHRGRDHGIPGTTAEAAAAATTEAAAAGVATAEVYAVPADPPGVVRYSGEVPLDRPGPFGYTVRVLPSHPLLDSRAELGLVTYPQAQAGMTNGDLR